MPSKEELLDLCTRLRGEKLLVNSDLEHLQLLNNEVSQKLTELVQIAWISRQQQLTFLKLIRSNPDATPQNSCKYVRFLEKTKFIESNRKLGQYESPICDLIRVLLHNTQIVAEFLCSLDTFSDLSLGQDVSHILFSGLYGCCVFTVDEKFVSEVLINLMRLQLAQNQNSRRVLRRGNCAFSRLYRLFSEGLFSAKLFLTCALHEPIMDVLTQDELFLDIDPSKAVFRFPPQERFTRFGEEGTPQYKENLSKYRKIIVNKLLILSEKFINGLKSSLHCFPPVLTLLVRQLHEMLRNTGKISEVETTLICTDLIFTDFICPAITKPEPLGIIDDMPISYIARFNLMQIGQILQSLAVSQFEMLDPKLNDLYSQFDQESVGGIVRSILSSSDNFTLDDIYPASGQSVHRQVSLLSLSELDKLVTSLRRCQNVNGIDRWIEIKDILKRLPERFVVNELQAQPTVEQNGHGRSSANSPSRKKTLKLPRPRVPHIHRSPSGECLQVNSEENATDRAALSPEEPAIEVLMISLTSDTDTTLGLIPEEKFLANLNKSDKDAQNATSNVNDVNVSGEKRTRFDLESLGTATSDQLDASSDDQESVSSSLEGIGNPVLNDNFSDVDGLPISANVSGRGSPNISGRDTPMSLHTEQPGEHEPEDTPSSVGGAPKVERKLPELPDTARKENRADIEEKFGKFELPQPHPRERHRDETHSLVSDSWSTDVLASESEFGIDLQNLPGAAVNAAAQHGALPDLVPGGGHLMPDIPRLDLIAEEIVVSGSGHPTMADRAAGTHLEVGDRSDTWSVDATASDSEAEVLRNEDRMKEFDDCTTIASGQSNLNDSVEQFVSAVGVTSEDSVSDSAAVEGMFPTDGKIFNEKHLLRRQSSGSSFLSKSEVDIEDQVQVGSFGEKYEPEPQQVVDPFLPPLPSTPASKSSKNETGGPPGSSISKYSAASFDSDPSVSDDKAGGLEMSLERQSLGRLSLLMDNLSLEKAHSGHQNSESARSSRTLSSTPSINTVDTNVSSSTVESEKKKDMQSTGAIPKRNRPIVPNNISGSLPASVRSLGNHVLGSFDKDDKKQQRNFFKNFKLSNLKSKVRRSHTEHSMLAASYNNNNEPNLSLTGIPHSSSADIVDIDQCNSNETGEQILAKYRRHGTAAPGGGDSAAVATAPLVDLSELAPISNGSDEAPSANVRPYYDSANVTSCQAFVDIKRKLRMLLSSVDVGTLPSGWDVVPSFGLSNMKSPKEMDLIQFLNVLLAEALNTRQKFLCAQLQEVLRCLTLFDGKSVRKLMRALHEENRHRTAYLNYLQQSRHALLQIRSYLNKLINKVQCEQLLSAEWLVEFCARLYLEQRWDKQLRNFGLEFQKLELQDEKTEFVEKLLSTLYSTMLRDPMWQSASEDQLSYAQLSIERCVMSQIYVAALYPNGDADVLRDQVFYDTIAQLSSIITPTHKDLKIPAEYHAECPWPLAQAELAIITVYKTPRDKLGCVLRCCETIVHLLRVSRVSGAPAADDIMPVLVFVLIKANPPALLSTVQFINGFYGKRLQGEEAYWWTQFCSAVEFIKVMADYSTI